MRPILPYVGLAPVLLVLAGLVCPDAPAEELILQDLVGHWEGQVAIPKVSAFTPCAIDIWNLDGKLRVFASTLIGVDEASEVKLDGRTLFLKIPGTTLGTVNFMGRIKGKNVFTFIFEVGFYTGYGVLDRAKDVDLIPDEKLAG